MTKSSDEKQIKVCLVAISLSDGGAERSTALLSKMLVNEGFDVHLAIVKNNVDYDYSGTLFSLGPERKSFGIITAFFRLLKFRKYLKRNAFDMIVDNRTRPTSLKEMIYTDFIYRGMKLIYVVRSSNLKMYFPKKRSVVLKQASNVLKYIAVSKEIVKMIKKEYSISNCSYIYNPLPLKKIREESLIEIEKIKGDYIIAMGRLDESVKNYSLLLSSYKQSKLPESNITLKILGKGPDESLIKEKIKELDLIPYVEMIPFTSNPFPWLRKARFTVLTSRFEGFPRVLIESLAIGTPVLSVDCVSGPSEIIKNGFNGILVPNNKESELEKAMNNLIFDKELYNTCKNNAMDSVSHLDVEIISKQWKQLIQNEL